MNKDISFTNENHPLVLLYGENALHKSVDYINLLKQKANFNFTNEIMSTGIGFLNLKALEVHEGKRKNKPSLEDLVTESFGEASMYVLQFKESHLKGK